MKLFKDKENSTRKNRYSGLEQLVDEIIGEGYGFYSFRELREDITDRKMNSVLFSFRTHDELNPNIWDKDGEMDKQVRFQLLQIADEFINFLNIKWLKFDDIILTGSLANYNWSRFSDFDLHIVLDFNKIDRRTDFVKEYFDSKKILWNQDHEELKIYGYPVELYVQDSNEKHDATGVYSLEREEWIRKPSKKNVNKKIDREKVKKEAVRYAKEIDKISTKCKHEKDRHKLEILFNKTDEIYDKIYNMRRKALRNEGEMSMGNIIFKALRRLGYIDRIREIHGKLFDKINSIE